MAFDMGDYKEVSERLVDLFVKYPEASVRGTYEFVTIAGDSYVVYRAECYRHAQDSAPGVGTAWEPIPGKTPYTKGSEVQNAETSAWGRAIVAVGASESKRIASADEMRLSRDRQSAPPRRVPASKDRIEKCKALILERDLTEWIKAQGYEWPWNDEECGWIELYAQNQPGPQAKPAEDVTTREESKEQAWDAPLDKLACAECGMAGGEHAEGCQSVPF